MQEVGLGGAGFDMLAYLGKACDMNAVAAPTWVSHHGDFGNGALTRHNIATVQRLDLSVPRREPRSALDVVFSCQGKALRIVSTHLGLRPGDRRLQVKKLLEHVRDVDVAPLILTGDLNEWFLWGRPLRWLHRHFESTPASASFPSRWPLFALDRIWVQPRSALRRVWVHKSRLARIASDHLPVLGEIELG